MNHPVELNLSDELLVKIEEFMGSKKLSFDEVIELAIKKILPVDIKKHLTPTDIQNVIDKVEYNDVPNTNILICVLTLKNGAKVIGANYGSIDPTKYKRIVAEEMAYKDAYEKIWELEGYLLRQRLYESSLIRETKN